MADVLIGVTHFTGHELSGFGGTLKNLGMGCKPRRETEPAFEYLLRLRRRLAMDANAA
jgi:hypothetical protein